MHIPFLIDKLECCWLGLYLFYTCILYILDMPLLEMLEPCNLKKKVEIYLLVELCWESSYPLHVHCLWTNPWQLSQNNFKQIW